MIKPVLTGLILGVVASITLYSVSAQEVELIEEPEPEIAVIDTVALSELGQLTSVKSLMASSTLTAEQALMLEYSRLSDDRVLQRLQSILNELILIRKAL